MATYVNDLRLKEIATGDESGTWGTSTNTNLELIGEALGYGTQEVFSSDADATTTIADGASDPARAMYFKITSGVSLTATRTCTIAPNTVSRVMFIENATTGSQSITISQGSGANVTIATGKTAVVYLDGAGATAAVVDAMAGVDPGVTDTLAEVLVAGNTSGGTNIELSTTDKVQFRDTAIYINSSADGQLDIVADTEVQIATTTVDLNGILDVSGNTTLGADVTFTGASYNAVWDSSDSALEFADNAKAIFGAGSDLQIYHDATSNIIDSSAATLAIQAPQFVVQDDTGAKNIIWVTQPAASVFDVRLSYDGSTKLATTATGIDVTGTVTADGLTVDDVVSIDTSTGNAFSSTGNLKIDIDSDNNQTDRTFQITSDGSSKTLFQAKEGGDISFYDDTGVSQSFFWDASAESLGIGTSSPSSQLDILGSSSRIRLDGSAAAFQILSRNTVDSATNPIIFDADTYTFNRAGSTQAVIDASGNVGIGQDTPKTTLNLGANNSGQGAILTLENTDTSLTNNDVIGQIDFYANDGSTNGTGAKVNIKAIATSTAGTLTALTFGTSNSTSATAVEAMRIDANGNVGIGDNNPLSILHIGGGSDANVPVTFAPSTGGNAEFRNTSSTGTFTFTNNNGSSEAMRIDGSGNLLVGTTSSSNTPSQGIALMQNTSVGSIGIGHANGTSSGNGYMNFAYNGGAIGSVTQSGTTAVLYNTSSDQRLKENIADADDAGSKVDAIQVRKFDWKSDGSHQDYGMVAQELQTVAPEAVSGDADSEEMMGVDYSKLVPMLVKEIQSLRARVAALES